MFIVSQKCFEMVIIGPNWEIWVQSNTKYKNGQSSQKHFRANYQIFEYIQIFRTNIFIRKNIRWFFSRANLFGYSFVFVLSCQVYSDIHSSNIYGNKYIWIFILPKKKGYSSHTGKNQCCAIYHV